jgi:hypothetical protein
MTMDIVESRLKDYQPKTRQEEINAFKEICQEIALSGLSRSEFFKKGAFQGGTCLRILYGLKRFSEDLDFVLLASASNFTWDQYLKSIELEFASFGLELQVLDRSQVQGAIKRAFLKETSFGKVLKLKHGFLPSDKQSIKIKLEIDVLPPEGSGYETRYLNYPYPFSILCQDMPSLFAGKCHSLLCRSYQKGRDWFDFLWYLSKKTPLNYFLLANALFQAGPFAGKRLTVDKDWVCRNLLFRINDIDWQSLRSDIEPFLKSEDRKFVEHWNKDLFVSLLKNF